MKLTHHRSPRQPKPAETPLNLKLAFPSPTDALKLQQHSAPAYARCPKGHGLPNRQLKGTRCTPVFCADDAQQLPANVVGAHQPYAAEMAMLPPGLEGSAYKQKVPDTPEAVRVQEQAKEAVRLMGIVGARTAREALFPMPTIPVAPGLENGVDEYVQRRLEQVTPYALELEIFDLLYGTKEERREARRLLLARAGHGDKPEAKVDYRGPVQVVVNLAQGTPYDVQVTKRTVGELEAQVPPEYTRAQIETMTMQQLEASVALQKLVNGGGGKDGDSNGDAIEPRGEVAAESSTEGGAADS